VNAAKSVATLGATQSKGNSGRKNGKAGGKQSKPVRAIGKPAVSKPPVRNTKAKRK